MMCGGGQGVGDTVTANDINGDDYVMCGEGRDLGDTVIG